MNYKKYLIFGICSLFILCFMSGPTTAYTDNGTYFTCHNCSDCMNAMNDGKYSEIRLGTDIINHSGTCITCPVGVTNKIFDGQNHTISGDGTGYGIILWGGRHNNTIQNCNISNFDKGFRSTSNNNITLTGNTFQSYAYFYGTGNDITVEDCNFSGTPYLGMLDFDYETSVGTDIIIHNNTFSNITGSGVLFRTNNYENVTIQGNTLSNISEYGICVIGTNVLVGGDEESEKNTISSTKYGIKGSNTNITITGNAISGVLDNSGYGIILNAEDSEISNNVISNSPYSTGLNRLIGVSSNNVTIDNNTLNAPYFIGMLISGNNATITNNTVSSDGTTHGGVYLGYDTYGGLVQYNDIWNLDFSCDYTGPPYSPSARDYIVQDNTLGNIELKGGCGNTITNNTLTGSCWGWAGTFCNNDVYGNTISYNTFTGSSYIQVLGKWRFYNNTISHNTFTTTNSYALHLNNTDNNTIENNNVISSTGDAFQFTANTFDNKGCGNIGAIADLGTNNYVSNTSQSCYIWDCEDFDNIGRLACNKTYILGIDFQSDCFSFRTSGLTLKDKNLNDMMFLHVYPSNATINITLTSWNSALKRYDEVGIGTCLKYTINVGEVGKNYTVSIYALSNNTKLQTFYISSNSSGYVIYNTTGFGHDRYTEMVPIDEPMPFVIVVSLAAAAIAGAGYTIRKWVIKK